MTLITSAVLLDELRRVLAYPKLAKAIPDGAKLADLIEMASVTVTPTRMLHLIEDESDTRVLEAAVDGAADYIVSGDEHLLILESFRGIPILTPVDFVKNVLAG